MKTKYQVIFQFTSLSILCLLFSFIDISMVSYVLVSCVIIGFLLALAISLWRTPKIKDTFTDHLQFSFGVSSLLFMIIYLFICLQPIISQ